MGAQPFRVGAGFLEGARVWFRLARGQTVRYRRGVPRSDAKPMQVVTAVRNPQRQRGTVARTTGHRWSIRLFNGLSAERGTHVLSQFPTRKTAALLAYLAYYADRQHPRDVLIEML